MEGIAENSEVPAWSGTIPMQTHKKSNFGKTCRFCSDSEQEIWNALKSCTINHEKLPTN